MAKRTHARMHAQFKQPTRGYHNEETMILTGDNVCHDKNTTKYPFDNHFRMISDKKTKRHRRTKSLDNRFETIFERKTPCQAPERFVEYFSTGTRWVIGMHTWA
jgi:hypothetical protein